MQISKQAKKFKIIVNASEYQKIISGDATIIAQLSDFNSAQTNQDTLMQTTVKNLLVDQKSMPLNALIELTLYYLSPTIDAYVDLRASINDYIQTNPDVFTIARASYQDGLQIVKLT